MKKISLFLLTLVMGCTTVSDSTPGKTGGLTGTTNTTTQTDYTTGNPTTPSTESDTPTDHVACTAGPCEAYVYLNYSALHPCLSSGSAWITGTPSEIVSAPCDPVQTTGQCQIYLGGCSVFPTVNADNCETSASCAQGFGIVDQGGDVYVDSSGTCTWDYHSDFDAIRATRDDLLTRINAAEQACGIDWLNPVPDTEFNPGAFAYCSTGCDTDTASRMVAPGMIHGLQINHTNSFVLVTQPGGSSHSFPLNGSIMIGSGNKVIGGRVMIDSGTFDGLSFSGWHVFSDAPISYTGTTSVTITPTQEAAGQVAAKGTVAGVTKSGWMNTLTGHNITGTLNFSSGTWSMDYSETFPGSAGVTLQIHLVGTTY